MSRTRSAPAKVNLGLHVLRRRQDGYHEIETVFQPLGWSDALTAEAFGELALSTSDAALPTDRGNLVWRSAEALAKWAGIAPEARLHLEKNVPYGAGLGSGSSDAAATMLLLAGLWELDVPEAEMHALAVSLGADVPFFLQNRPMLGVGLGTELSPIHRPDGSIWECPFWLTVVVPDVHVSTAEAYALVTPLATGRSDLVSAIVSDDLDLWNLNVTNDFQAPVVARHPEVGKALDALKASGAGWASLSGSGSSVVGAFESEDDARGAARTALASGARVWVEPSAVRDRF